ncbi:hypothetical protein HDU97_001665 [Phlyctochytrium planicorne]|nr:hypothetical protein HDU97_001665 [Phlyctochytrium planicorne]
MCIYSLQNVEKLFVCSGQLYPFSASFKTQCFVDVTRCKTSFMDIYNQTRLPYIPKDHPPPLYFPSNGRSNELDWYYDVDQQVNIALFPDQSSIQPPLDVVDRYWKERAWIYSQNATVEKTSNFTSIQKLPDTNATLISDTAMIYEIATLSNAGLSFAPEIVHVDEVCPEEYSEFGFGDIDGLAASGRVPKVKREMLPFRLKSCSSSTFYGEMACYHQILVCDSTVENGKVIETSNCLPAPFYCEDMDDYTCMSTQGVGISFRTDTALASAVQGAFKLFGKPNATLKHSDVTERYFNTTSNGTEYEFTQGSETLNAFKQMEQGLGLLHFAWALSTLSLFYDPDYAGKIAMGTSQADNATKNQIYSNAFKEENLFLQNLTVKVYSYNPVEATAIDLPLFLALFLSFFISFIGSLAIMCLTNSSRYRDTVQARRLRWDPVMKYAAAKKEHMMITGIPFRSPKKEERVIDEDLHELLAGMSLQSISKSSGTLNIK